jgi:hypothetical protein
MQRIDHQRQKAVVAEEFGLPCQSDEAVSLGIGRIDPNQLGRSATESLSQDIRKNVRLSTNYFRSDNKNS